MFTGIIENFGIIRNIDQDGSNKHFDLESSLAGELRVDQSLAHDGVCLTVVHCTEGQYRVTAVQETLQKTTCFDWAIGKKVNLERCMPANGRFDGHIVQGHVDQLGTIHRIVDQEGSWIFEVEYDSSRGNLTVEKGSITINGVSLTCFDSQPGKFSVAIIPYTYTHTNFHQLSVGDAVNLEFDIIGKYVKTLLQGSV